MNLLVKLVLRQHSEITKWDGVQIQLLDRLINAKIKLSHRTQRQLTYTVQVSGNKNNSHFELICHCRGIVVNNYRMRGDPSSSAEGECKCVVCSCEDPAKYKMATINYRSKCKI